MVKNRHTDEAPNTKQATLGDLLFKYLPYWPGIVFLILISLLGAWFYLRYSLPIYQTTATILIKDDKKTGSLDPLEAFDLFGGKKSVENEVEILKSKTLMQEVVKNLHLYAPLTAKGRVVTSNAYEISPIIIEIKNVDSLKKVSNIPFFFDEKQQTVVINNQTYPLNKFVSTQYGVLKFLPNTKYKSGYLKGSNNEISLFFSLNTIRKTANSVLNGLNISQSGKQSTVINIIYSTEVPQLGEDIINELLEVYNQAAILDKNVLAANTLKFVESRLEYVVKDLDSVESSLQSFKARNKIVDISTQGEIYLKTVAENDQKISEINMQLAMLEQIQAYVGTNGNLGGIVPSTMGVTDPVLTNLLVNLSELEVKYEQTKKIVPGNNPAIVSIVDAMDKLRPGILENIKSQRKNLIAAKENLSNTNDRFSSLLTNIPEKEKELLGISRQQSIKNNIYTFLLQKREETALSFASAVADSRIIDKAETSDNPVSPKRMFIYLGALLGALALGIGFIYIKDLLNRTVQSKDEIASQTSTPILGEVSFDRSKSPIVIGEGKRSLIAEQFRQLRTSLGYLGIDENNKRILITSSISGEGKSFIAINLGISLALMNKKVAILELDLRKPKLSEVFNINRSVGISNYLVGKKNLQEILKPTGVENMVLLPSGPIPPNPSELISNGRLEILLQELEVDFDYIIIDSAPTNPVTDAFLISPMVAVTVYVVRHDYTPKEFLEKLELYRSESRLKNLSVVYNGNRGVGIEKYGYGYGYGYTEEIENRGLLAKIFSRRRN